MPNICFYFQVHPPYRLRRFRMLDIGTGKDFFQLVKVLVNRAKEVSKIVSRCQCPNGSALKNIKPKGGMYDSERARQTER